MTDLDTAISHTDKLKLLEEKFPKIERRLIIKYLNESNWDLQKAL